MTTTVPTRRLYRLGEARELLSLGKTQLQRELRAGRLGSVGTGKARRVRAEDIDAYIRLLASESGADR